MARKFRHRKRRLTQFGHGARPTNALADSDVFCGEFRPFTIMPLTSKSRGGDGAVYNLWRTDHTRAGLVFGPLLLLLPVRRPPCRRRGISGVETGGQAGPDRDPHL